MNEPLYDNIEVSIDEVDDISTGEERDSENGSISKRNSVVEDNIHHVLHLDDHDDTRQQVTRQSTEKDQKPESIFSNAYPCKDTHKTLPRHPSTWPQRPLMIRPTPRSSTKIIGIVSLQHISISVSLTCISITDLNH